MADKYPQPASLHSRKARRLPPARPERRDAWPAWLKHPTTGEKRVFQSLDQVPRGQGWGKDGVPVHPEEREDGYPEQYQADEGGAFDREALIRNLVQAEEDRDAAIASNAELIAENKALRARVAQMEGDEVEPEPEDDVEEPGQEEWLRLDLEGLRQRCRNAGMDDEQIEGANLRTLRVRYRKFLEGEL